MNNRSPQLNRTLSKSIQRTTLMLVAGTLVGCSGGGERSNQTTDSRSNNQQAASTQSSRSTYRSSAPASSGLERSKRELKAFAVESLLGLASHPNAEIRVNALEALQGHTSSLESVVALGLSDETVAVRSVASMIVGKQNLRDLTPMVEGLLDDESPFVRASALFAIAKTHSRQAEPVDQTPLATMLLESQDIRVSSYAAYILGELGNPSAIPLLQQASGRPWGQTAPIRRQLFRLQLAEAMIKLGDRESVDAIRSALYPSRPEELEATALAIQIIGEVKDRGAIDQLIYLVDEDTDRPMPAEVRLAVAGSLAKLGLPEGGFIADEYFENSNPTIRAQAAAVYGQTGRSEHLAKLESLLEDESAQVRASSSGAILEILRSH